MTQQLGTVATGLPASAGAAVVPGASAGTASTAPVAPAIAGGGDYGNTPLPPALPGMAAEVAGGGLAPTTAAAQGEDPRKVAILQQLVVLLTELVAISGAQGGAVGVAGGGAAGAPVAGSGSLAPDMAIVGGVSVSGGGSVLGGGSVSTSVSFATSAPSSPVTPDMSVIGGSDVFSLSSSFTAMDQAMAAPAAGLNAIASGAAITTPISGGGGTAVTPQAAAAPQLDARRITGTPQAGGVIDTIRSLASGTASAARSEGNWTVLTDAGGAQLQAHVHGIYLQQPNLIPDALRSGRLQAHLHPDGTVHLHDVA